MSRRRFVQILSLLLGIVLIGMPRAEAHGPSRQKVTKTIEINAPPEKIWAVIANFHDMSWDPAVVKTEGEGGSAIDATRTLTLKSGGQITESLSRYEPSEFSYSTFLPHNDPKVLPVADFSTVLTVTAGEGGKSVVEWRGAAYRGYPNNDPPPELNDEAAVNAISAYLVAGLEGLKKKVEGSAS
ncbi:MAG TPA: SRPBCC family protein [Aliidongia sp.]|nr:SRPBCC family protein [Aliidongia sp.]